jgi:hypothetical protein
MGVSLVLPQDWRDIATECSQPLMKTREPHFPIDRHINIELINWPFLQAHRGSPAEYKAGLDLAIERG